MVKHLGLAFFASRFAEARRGSDKTEPVEQSGGRSMRAIFSIFPLLLFPVVFYNLVAFGFTGAPAAPSAAGYIVSPAMEWLNNVWFALPMISGVTWEVTGGDVLIIASMALLFMEILKSTSTGTATIINHAVSLILFIVCLVEFLMNKNFATSVFFIITVMTLLDVLAGVVVTIVSARRDFAVGEGFGG